MKSKRQSKRALFSADDNHVRLSPQPVFLPQSHDARCRDAPVMRPYYGGCCRQVGSERAVAHCVRSFRQRLENAGLPWGYMLKTEQMYFNFEPEEE